MKNPTPHHYLKRALLGAALFLLSAAAQSAPTASAQETEPDKAPKLSIEPVGVPGPYFDVQLQAGETKQLVVALGNDGDAPVAARTYSSDAFTTPNGGLGSKLGGEAKSGPTMWLSYVDEELQLPPGASVERSFTVTVPPGTGAGEHLTSLVIENQELVGSADGASRQRLRQVIALLVTIPGPRTPAFSAGEARHTVVGKNSVLSVALVNSGNVRLKLSGSMVIRDDDRRDVATAPLQMGSFYAGTNTDVEAPLASVLKAGRYRIALKLEDPQNDVRLSKDFTIVVKEDDPVEIVQGSVPDLTPVDQDEDSDSRASPYLLPGAILAGAVALGLLVRRPRRRADASGKDET